MKIRLIENLPIAQEHGCKAGCEFEVVKQEEFRRNRKVFFRGDTGELCAAFSHEYIEVET